MSGYVRIHRTLCGHPAFRNDAEAMAFAWLVTRAAWKPARVRYKDRAIVLDRGQLAISVRDFASAMDRDKAWVERLLKRLRAETMIETRHETGVNVITICNYNEYQNEPVFSETARETPRDTQARQAQDTEQEREEGKKKEGSEAKASSPRGKFPAPPCVADEQWSAFRGQRKKPLNARSYALICNKLLKLAEDGWPPGDMIDLAIERGWETVFAPRTFANGQPASNVTSLRGSRPDPALDLYRAACEAEDRENRGGTGLPLPAIGSG